MMVLATTLAAMFWTGCGRYACHDGFGLTTCNSGSSGGGSFGGAGGGGGGNSNLPTAFVYAADEGGTIDGYQLNPTADTFLPITGFTAPAVPDPNGGGVGMVVAQSKYLYAGFAETDQLFGWSISSSGALTTISGSPYSADFLSHYVNGVGRENMITNPAGTLLFVSDAIYGVVYVYQIGTGGALTAATGSPFSCPSGFVPMNLATDGLGKYLYVVSGNYTTHQGSEIAAFSIGTGGVLTAVTGSPFVYPMWQVQGEPTGQFLIGTTGSWAYNGVADDLHLYVFSIEQSGTSAGAITPVTGSPFTTVYSPYNIAVQPDTGGALVYSVGINDTDTAYNPIEGYSISSSGTLTAVTGSPFSNVGLGSWAQFDQSGDYLLVNETVASSTVISEISPLEVGNGGALTQPISTEPLVTPGFWTVTDAP
jgi:6-phosphogluconolactonase